MIASMIEVLDGHFFDSGRLAIPIAFDCEDMDVFIPCGGLNDNDEVPEWVKTYHPEDISLGCTPSLLYLE